MPSSEIKRTYKDRHPEKAAAHAALTGAIRRGELVRLPCEVCGATETEGHHDDYSRPLDVRWLCKEHHLEAHHGRFGTQAPPVDSIPPATVAQTVPASEPSPFVAAGGDAVETPATHSPEEAPEVAAGRARKPSIESDAEPVRQAGGDTPTIASRLRALHGEHPELTAIDVAGRLDLTASQVRSNSAVHGIKWADAPTRPDRQGEVLSLHEAHRDWTDEQLAAELGVMAGYVRAVAARLNLKLPSRKAQKSPVEAPESVPPPKAIAEPERPPQPAFVAPANEENELTEKRHDVVALHNREPWLTPEEAAARVMIPVVNLRIFSTKLGIAWSQPRPDTSAIPAPSQQPQMMTLRDKVAAVHRHHSAWTARMIADHLGAPFTSVSTYLAAARSADQVERPVEREQASAVA